MLPASISCQNISKYFGPLPAVESLSLEIPAGRILALLGPSGCGKTTVLRLLAGFEKLDGGEIEIDGDGVAGSGRHLPPEKRRIGMVFQDYAIFPHLTVAENIGFGLNGRNSGDDRIEYLLRFVGLDGLGHRMPYELSGGQQQRVALARALAPSPRALLLDEPFSNLDATLRTEVRAEVRELLRQSGTTTLFVTHDQEEALFFGDLIAVMRSGRIEQVGTPEEVFLQPQTRFVAAFMGQTDFIPGLVKDDGIETPLGQLDLAPALPSDTPVEVALRPNQVSLATDGDLNGQILSRQFQGIAYLYRVALFDGSFVHSWQPHKVDLPPGTSVQARIRTGYRPPVFYKDRAIEIPPE